MAAKSFAISADGMRTTIKNIFDGQSRATVRTYPLIESWTVMLAFNRLIPFLRFVEL